jgi:hypothetical protein
MAFARDVYTASAAQTDFTISYAYIEEAHVEVYKDGVLQTAGAGNDYTIVSSTIVRFTSGMVGGETVILQRATSQSTRLVDYATASTLTEEDLDNDSLQAFYMAQESIDQVATAMGKTVAEEWDFDNTASDNVPTPTAGDQVANKTYVDAQVIAAGNVPTPDNPGDDGYALIASGGTFDWALVAAVLLTGAQTAAGAKTWSDAAVFSSTLNAAGLVTVTAGLNVSGGDLNLTLADDGAAAGPSLDLVRDSASPAAADLGSRVRFIGKDSGDNDTTYAALQSAILDPTGASEDGELQVHTMLAGAEAERFAFGAGLYSLNATGGDQGIDTINVDAVYENGVRASGWKTIVDGTALSGASIDFTGMPSWANEFMVIVQDASHTISTGDHGVRIGDSGGIESTGYQNGSWSMTSATVLETAQTDRFQYTETVILACSVDMSMVITNYTGNTWTATGSYVDRNVTIGGNHGTKVLSGTLDRIQLFTDTGVFDAGSVWILAR